MTYEGRQEARKRIAKELSSDVSATDTRAKALATALRAIDRIEAAVLREEEDERDRQKLAELRRIREAQDAMRSGGVTKNQAPQLPEPRNRSAN